jgi:uncharacterized protein YndB with AHSA1/START domain
VLVARHQAFVSAPARNVWELVGRPDRHPEWWPEIVEVQGKQFGRGCSYCQIAEQGDQVSETEFKVERLEELKELVVRCEETGMYMRWLLTEAQEGTFVDAEFGIDPKLAAAVDSEFDPAASKDQLRRWLHSSLDGLAVVAQRERAGS